jgi:cobalt-zinc-cadmium efflux system protein
VTRGKTVSDGVALLIRILLGLVFLYASIDKIIHAAAFAQTVFHYQVFPNLLVNLTTIVLPWLEALLGLSLISGIMLPGAVFLSNILLSLFLVLLLSAVLRGLDIDCGCFVTGQASENGVSMGWYALRDGVFLALALYLLFNMIGGKRTTVGKATDASEP